MIALTPTPPTEATSPAASASPRHAKLSAAAAAPFQPKCPAGHAMAVSDYAAAPYDAGYWCDICRNSSSRGHLGGDMNRWWCQACSSDICLACFPRGGTKVEWDAMRGAQDAAKAAGAGQTASQRADTIRAALVEVPNENLACTEGHKMKPTTDGKTPCASCFKPGDNIAYFVMYCETCDWGVCQDCLKEAVSIFRADDQRPRATAEADETAPKTPYEIASYAAEKNAEFDITTPRCPNEGCVMEVSNVYPMIPYNDRGYSCDYCCLNYNEGKCQPQPFPISAITMRWTCKCFNDVCFRKFPFCNFSAAEL